MSAVQDLAEGAAEGIARGIAEATAPPAPRRQPASLPGEISLHAVDAVVGAANAPVSIPLDAFGSGAYGLTQLSVTTEGDERAVTLQLEQTYDGRRIVLEPALVLAYRRLFEVPLRAPLRFPRADRLRFTATATEAGGTGRVRAALHGLDADQLRALEAAGRIAADGSDEPVLMAQTVTVPAGATAHEVTFEPRGGDLLVRRLVAAAGTEAADLALTLTPRTQTANLLPPLTPRQLLDFFGRRHMTPAVPVPGNRPLKVYVGNPTDADVPLSIVVEAYRA